MINILLIGSGSWGVNYIKTMIDFPLVNLIIGTRNNWKSLVDKKPHGAIIATNPDSHVSIAKYCLERNIPVIIEKPLALSLEEALDLKPYSNKILVNHIHLFSDAYNNIKKLISYSDIKKIVTNGVGPVSRNYSNLFDYGAHEICFVLDLIKELPKSVSCHKVNFDKSEYYNIFLEFNKAEAQCKTGVDPYKQRNLFIKTDEFEIYYDDLERPKSHNKPLHNVLSVFFDFIITDKKDSRMGIDMSLNVIDVLNKCQLLI